MRNVLNMTNFVRLADWLRENWQSLEGASDNEVANTASRNLGFKVVPQNILTACQATNINRAKTKSAIKRRSAVSRHDFLILAQEIRLAVRRQGVTNGTQALDDLIAEYSVA